VTSVKITVIILRNMFSIKYSKKTFLNPDFCNFWAQFDSQRQKLFVKPSWSEKVTVLSTFLESLLNFLSNNLKKTPQNLVQSEWKAVLKFELTETQFERTVRDKIDCKTQLEQENYFLSTFLKSSLDFLSNNLKKTPQNVVQSEWKAVSKLNCHKHSLKKLSGTK